MKFIMLNLASTNLDETPNILFLQNAKSFLRLSAVSLYLEEPATVRS
jgi:hypothetical protein